jgi:GNAT superfamily N-acetyltransferase
MWEEILDVPARGMSAADEVYRRWARTKLKARELIGFIIETPRGVPVASACIWLMPTQPRPLRKGTVAPYLMSMYTEKAHRGRGHATRLTRAAVQWSQRSGYTVLLLHASRFGRPIYEGEGFEASNEMRLYLSASPRKRPRRGKVP